ncbi:GNAT family N-acetyltransferase [Metabacillus sp. RGM 3146]|uniref:GNAT family N-acetyltransferase n=1 Tax=Metabacillus sp. RGM 3146 TaxID=3401092 RepID=UPI003B996567
MISTDKTLLNTDLIHSFLSEHTYWANGLAKDLVIASIENSQLCYGLHKVNPEKEVIDQVGFARVVTDFVRFSYLGDVFILPEFREVGLGKWLISIIVSHPYLKGTSFNLATKDAHSLYEQFGFKELEDPARKMERPRDMKAIYDAYNLPFETEN